MQKVCIKGAIVGGVAGHHGVLGAAAGCIVGHHEAKREKALQSSHEQR
jgi:hypothetical protein